MKQLFISWTFMRRPESMQPYFGYEIVVLSSAFKNRILRPLEYLIKGWQSLNLFVQKHPQAIWVQIAPTPLLYIAYLYKTLFNRKLIIIADCHNSTFRAPWINLPGVLSLLNYSDSVLVHNDLVYEQASKIGVVNEKLCILEDRPAIFDVSEEQQQVDFPHPWVLFPCSFNMDEPIKEVLDAASLSPEITFILTGKAERAQGLHDLSNLPNNVKLVGFLPKIEFDRLLKTADAILGLTIFEGVQISVASEAVGICKPMILSHTKLLKKLFYKGAVNVDPLNPECIARGCEEAISHKSKLTEEVFQLREERNKHWLTQASKVNAILG